MQELRLYTFINFYLSSIQQGIQTAHIVQELNNKYCLALDTATRSLNEWADKHKTIIVCNGGGTAELNQAIEMFTFRSCYPMASFHESDNCLSGVLTGFGVILPERIFAAELVKNDLDNYYTYFDEDTGQRIDYLPIVDDDFEVIQYVKSRPLAR